MPRYTVYTKHYTFNPPRQITEAEFKYYKELLRSNPSAKLNTKLPESPLKKALNIGKRLAITPLYLIAPYQIEGDIKSAINKSKAQREEDEFYGKLKALVVASDTFQQFSAFVKETFPYYR